VRDAEGGETTPSFGHPSNVRRGETTPSFGHPPMLGGAEAALPFFASGAKPKVAKKGLLSNLPVSLLIGGKGGCIPLNRRKGRFSPTRSTPCKGRPDYQNF